MRPTPDSVTLSASDLGGFLSCRHKTALDLAVAKKLRPKPPKYPDPVLEILIARGFEHEESYVDAHREKGRKVVDLSEGDDRVARTIAAMKDGADIIVQGQLHHEGWGGYPDILERVGVASGLGDWSYQVVDTKLSRETKGTTILQLALYSDIVGVIQGRAPEFFFVVTPDQQERYRLNDYAAYYRLVKRGLASAVTGDPLALAGLYYPEPVDHCDLCRWDHDCRKKRRADDHLSLVAGISRLQRRELEPRGVTTLAGLGRMPIPIAPPPERGSLESYTRVREQARVQLEGREQNTNIHEMLLPVEAGQGLTRLPEPSPGDIFLDLEGDTFARDGGREYLFGVITADKKGKLTYTKQWAFTDAEECAAFERVMGAIVAALEADPGAHIYHFGHYEPTAFKKLMGRYATRESDMDRLLRGERFVDLHTVVKQGLRASVEKYSIKDLETFYGYTREMELRKAGDHRALVERCLETDSLAAITDEDRTIVEGYNRDDCVSTLRLRDWLETLRAELIAEGEEVPRPAPKEEEPSEELTEHEQRIRALMQELTKDVPAERSERTPEQQARWILAYLLEYHRREDKVAWWDYFRLLDLPLNDYMDEPRAIMGLTFVKRLDSGKRNTPLDRYTYPDQDCDIRDGETLKVGEEDLGVVVDQDREARTIDVKKRQAMANDHPAAVFAFNKVRARPLPEALERIALAVVEDGLESAGPFQAAWSLLTREKPRLRSAKFARKKGESELAFAVRVVTRLDGTVLPIQGPPGTGKTYTGAHMICELVKNGMRVGVTGPSHAVIENLLNNVVTEAAKQGLALTCGAKVKEEEETPGAIREFTDNDAALGALRDGDVQVLGGTPWLWANEKALDIVDVLVCDEAGQMSITNAVAASGAANSLVLLGDPQQLEQVQRGSHPDGTEVSALEHILGEHLTMPDERGIFLPVTWRMHPSICEFCSDVFYESRLNSRKGLENQLLVGAGRFDGAGLSLVAVEHEGNQNDSPEEVDEVEKIVDELLAKTAHWTNADGKKKPMTADDILVVSPYNRQVTKLYERLSARGIRVGTVDKFQGQQAPVVIYSMALSSPTDSSRSMEFVYSLSRLNVATSRAKCATILVASPKLFEPECRSTKQMKLANALCRYVEMATVVRPA